MDKKVLTTTIQLRRAAEAQWEAIKDSFIPAAGEPCVTLDGDNAGQIKIGDGVSAWGELKYSGNRLDVIKVYSDSIDDTSMSIDGIKYDTAAEAINAVPDGGTIKMAGGLGADEIINVEKKLTLDMNSAVIVDNNKCPIEIGTSGELTLSGNGSVECNKNIEPAINNCGKMIIENGSYTRTVDEKNDTFYTILNHGETTINGGVFQAPGNVSSMIENGYYDYNSTDPKHGHVAGKNAEICTLTINDGTFINAFYVVKNDDNGYYLEIPYFGLSSIYSSLVPLHDDYDSFEYKSKIYTEYKNSTYKLCYGFAYKEVDEDYELYFDDIRMNEIKITNPFTEEEFMLCYAVSDKTYNFVEMLFTPSDKRHTLLIK